MFKILSQTFSIISRKDKLYLFLLQFIMLATSVSEVIGIASIGPFMAIVSDPSLIYSNPFYSGLYEISRSSNEYEFIIFFAGLVICILLFSAIIFTLSLRFIHHYAQMIGANLCSDLFDHYMQSSWIFHTQKNSSQLIVNIGSECTRITAGIIVPSLVINARTIMAITIIAFLLWVDYKVTLFGFIFFGSIYVAIFSFVKRKLSSNSLKLTESQNIKFKSMNEGFGGIKELILLGRSDFFRDLFRKNAGIYGRSLGSSNTLFEVPKYWVELIAFGGMISLIIFLMVSSQQNLADFLPKLAVFIMASYRLIPTFQQIYMNISSIQFADAAVSSIADDLKEFRKQSQDIITDKVDFPNYNIELKSVNFSYPNKEDHVLRNISFRINENKMVGFVGPSGSGKSTLVDIIMGLLKPDSGTISIGGVSLDSKTKLRAWQGNIGYVPQSIFLSDDSIKKNVAFGLKDSEIDNSKIKKALDLSQLSAFISSLPKGIDTIVGEKGVQLSGGQRQRIAIARALYNNPSVLVLDEATSSLDGITEKKIMHSINKISKFMTVLIIAHRINTVKDCSEIFYLEDGKIFDQGSFEDLIKSNDKFRALSDTS